MSTTGMPTWSGMPAAHRTPRTAPDKPTIDSTDRSMSPMMMIGVMARAMIATSIVPLIEAPKLGAFQKSGWMKTSEIRVPTQIRKARMTRRSTSQRATADMSPRPRRPAMPGRRPAEIDPVVDDGRSDG